MQLTDMDGSRLVESQFSLTKCTAMTAEKSGVCVLTEVLNLLFDKNLTEENKNRFLK